MRYLGRVDDAQVRDALVASGATDEEAARFGRALRDRIGQLAHVAQLPTSNVPTSKS
jgi:hypothetical protein